MKQFKFVQGHIRPPEKRPRLQDFIEVRRRRKQRPSAVKRWWKRHKQFRFQSKHALCAPGKAPPLRLFRPFPFILKGKWQRRCLGKQRAKTWSEQIRRMNRVDQYYQAIVRFETHLQISIPEASEDGLYQMSPFFGDPDDPSVYPWAGCILQNRRDRFYTFPLMKAAVFEQYGNNVELRWWPIRFVFPNKQDAMMFLLRSG